jgi:hypothetical protein
LHTSPKDYKLAESFKKRQIIQSRDAQETVSGRFQDICDLRTRIWVSYSKEAETQRGNEYTDDYGDNVDLFSPQHCLVIERVERILLYIPLACSACPVTNTNQGQEPKDAGDDAEKGDWPQSGFGQMVHAVIDAPDVEVAEAD